LRKTKIPKFEDFKPTKIALLIFQFVQHLIGIAKSLNLVTLGPASYVHRFKFHMFLFAFATKKKETEFFNITGNFTVASTTRIELQIKHFKIKINSINVPINVL